MNRKFGIQLSTALVYGPIGIVWTFLPIHLRSLGSSFSLIALISLLPAVETIILSPLWGGLLDKKQNAMKILLSSMLALALGFTIFPFLTSPVQFVALVSIMGFFSSSFIPVYSAMATLVPNAEYGRGIGSFWTAAMLGFASASFLGGIVYEIFGVNYLFILGALYAYSGCIVILLAPKGEFTLNKNFAMSQGYWGVLRDRRLAVLCSLSILVLIASSAFNSFFTLYLVDVLNSSRLVAGLAATGTTVLGAAAYRFVGPLNDRFGRKPVFLLGTIAYAIYFGILYFVTNPIIATILWILPIYPLIQSSSAALAADYTSTADRGKGLGLLEASLSLGGGIGPLAGGGIADANGFQSIILFSLAASAVSAVGCKLFLKETQLRVKKRAHREVESEIVQTV